jgi:hypothetical protein
MILVLPEAASVTAVRGELAFLNAGYVEECGNNPRDILGLFSEDGHNSTPAGTNNVSVEIANADNIFEFNKTDSSGVRVASAATDRGKGFALYRDTTNSRVTVYDGTNANIRVRCIAHSQKDVVGDTGGRLLCMFLGPWRQLDSTS